MSTERSLKGAEAIFIALLTIGLMGLLFLIIYGNLSGNLGFASQSVTYNDSGYFLNGTASTLANGAPVAGFISLSVSAAYNTTDGLLISAANYTVDSTSGTIINATAYNWPLVSAVYTVTRQGTSELNSESVIGNLTAGATQFFTFSSVWFILTAITILIGIVLGVISIVKKTSGGGFAGKKNKSEFVS